MTMEPRPPLETARLSLRQLDESDAGAVIRLFRGDWGAVRHTGRMPWPVEEAPVRHWLALHVGPHSHSFLVTRREDRTAIGMAGFGGDENTAELGYAFGRRYWNLGYATEAVEGLVERAKSTGLCVLEAYAFPENPASARVLEKAGFQHRGLVERDYAARGGLRRVHHYLIQIREDHEHGP
jgi:ribosomal-protein-alanine N-acetyltransferase